MCIGNIKGNIYQLHWHSYSISFNCFLFKLRFFFGRVYINQICAYFLFIYTIFSLSKHMDCRWWLELSVVRTGINLFRYSIGKEYCTIKDCSNTAGQIGRFGKAVKLHPLSKSKAIRADWLHAISKENFTRSRCAQLCYDHFPGGISRNWIYTLPVMRLRQNKNIQDVSRKIRKSKCTTDNAIFYWTDHGEYACHCDGRRVVANFYWKYMEHTT